MTRIETYRDALGWLYARNQFSIKLGLENTRDLLSRLGNPEQGTVFLHVAGTNGKGSVCANLAAMLPALGFRRVGLYTSPHLVSFRERIRVDGVPISAAEVTGWLRRSVPVLEEFGPTYFECATAMAFDHFRERKCEVVVLETGLGGRLDATNVVTPQVVGITSISLDHVVHLGNTLESIWGEKLGIAKPGVPMVIDEKRGTLAGLAEQAAKDLGCDVLNLADRLEAVPEGFRLRGRFGSYVLPAALRTEDYQVRNAAQSVLMLEAFWGRELPAQKPWLEALLHARFPGRMQWIRGAGLLPVLLDGAHNPDGIDVLCRHLSNRVPGRPRILFAAMRDKNVPAIYRRLRELSADIVYLDMGPAFPRALKGEELRGSLEAGEREGCRGTELSWDNLKPLLEASEKGSPDYVMVCGSLYLLGEMIPLLLPYYRGLEEFGKMLEEETSPPSPPLHS